MAVPEVFKKLQPFIDDILKDPELSSVEITVDCKELTPEEALGSPGRDDFPLQKGKEKLMQAEIDGSYGQAYTDLPGIFFGSLKEALTLPPVNNYYRVVIIAALNAVCRKTKQATSTVHCRDKGPGECSGKLWETLAEKYGNPRIAVVGLQPAMVEQLARHFEIRVFDLDPDNIGQGQADIFYDFSSRGKDNPAFNLPQFFYRAEHICVVVAYDYDIVGIMGHGRGKGAAFQPQPGYQAQADVAGGPVPFDNGNF